MCLTRVVDERVKESMNAIRRYFSWASIAIIRKGALMSQKDVRRAYICTILSPFFAGLVLFIELTEPSETTLRMVMVWWLFGMMLLPAIVMPLTIYGYHNRHHIEASHEEPLDFAPAMGGALLGTALVPLGRMLFDWLGIG